MGIVSGYILPHPPVIVKEVGRGKEGEVLKTLEAYEAVAKEIGSIAPDTVVIISPHSVMYRDYIHISPGKEAKGDLSRFGADEVSLRVEYDYELTSELSYRAQELGISAGTLGERDKSLDHGTVVPLYFINKYLSGFKIVRIGISGLTYREHYSFGMCLQAVLEGLNRKAVIVASGDLSHKLKDEGPYEFAEEGPVFDKQVTEAMASGDFLSFMEFSEDFCDLAGECGLRSFIIMAGALDRKAVTPKLYSYEGTFGVGYAVASFQVTGSDPERDFLDKYNANQQQKLREATENEDEYVKLARLSLETYVKTRKEVEIPNGLPNELIQRQAGAFVSLKKDGRLRGCIGTISPTQSNLAWEIIKNAVSAGVGDPRFEPVTPEELDSLVYSVDVLASPEPISDSSMLDVERYGVIVSKGNKRGLLLPNLDGVATVKQQIEIALQKAGIPQDSNYSLERFEVVRHK